MPMIKIRNSSFYVNLLKTTVVKGKSYNLYKISNSRTAYYTFPYICDNKKHYLCNSKGDLSEYMKKFIFVETEDGNFKIEEMK